uniref:PH domain-containing protein n=1 Tax=Hucho hucho TaxID=62062 RepID=A0A4W5JH19_9TELE
MERTEMMYTINSQLDFKIKPFPLVSSSRWMVKRGELTAFVEENGIFSKRTSRHQVYFFLFNDVLILTRKKRWVHSLTSQSQLTPTVSLANHSQSHRWGGW